MPVSYRCAAAFLAGLVESVVSLVDVDGVEQVESAKRLKALLKRMIVQLCQALSDTLVLSSAITTCLNRINIAWWVLKIGKN